jgi:putative sigma-54 modulation protein
MSITITGRHLTVTQELQEYAEKKFSRFQKYFHKTFEASLVFSSEKKDRIVEANLICDGAKFHGSEKSETFFSSIDLLIDKLDKQIVKYKEKHSEHKGIRNEIPDSEIS